MNETFLHEWTIESFNSLFSNEITGHPHLRTEIDGPKQPIVVNIYPRGFEESSREYVSVEIASANIGVDLQIGLWILDSDKNEKFNIGEKLIEGIFLNI